MDQQSLGPPADLETDPRFPSGPWSGFFLQKPFPGRHWMELELTFRQGRLTGNGRDWVGEFTMDGTYDLDDGKCTIAKQYLGRHCVDYRGYNEGKGIWGTWEIPSFGSGGFHIWPTDFGEPGGPELFEEATIPSDSEPALV